MSGRVTRFVGAFDSAGKVLGAFAALFAVVAGVFAGVAHFTHHDDAKLDAASIIASASSTKAPVGDLSYGPDLTLDGKRTTAWVPAQGDGGVGAAITFRFDGGRRHHLARLVVRNGYEKSARLFARNNRLRTVRLTTDHGACTVRLRDVDREQSVDVPGGCRDGTARLVLTIEGVYAAARGGYPDDVALSEVRFWGH